MFVCNWRTLRALGVALALLTTACGPSVSVADIDAAPTTPDIDAPVMTHPPDARVTTPMPDAHPVQPGVDGSGIYGDADVAGGDGATCPEATCQNPVADNCQATEDCGPDGTGNGLDDDCNGQVDENCGCTPGATKPYFNGPPGRRHVGACMDGTETCVGDGEFGHWGACVGGISPTEEACDTVDNNCNGCVDDNPACCMPTTLMCPTSMPDGQPFTDYPIDGTMFFGGAATKWTWTVKGSPCDDLFQASRGKPNFTLAAGNTAPAQTETVSSTTSGKVTFHPNLSGDYTFTMTVVGTDGMTYTCTFIVHIRGPGLRVELCWDTSGSVDLDLHLHKPGTTTAWFGAPDNPSNDDCYFDNCTADGVFGGGSPPNWGYASTAVSNCQGDPTPYGQEWVTIGSCRNPRLDQDNIDVEAEPENVNIDNPANGKTYRVMIHYYGNADDSSMPTHPLVNIYCGGFIKATYGQAPSTVANFDMPGGFAAGPMWRVADVTTQVDGSGNTTGCQVNAIHPPGMTSGYYVTTDDTTF
jgi:hypothetical protein